MMLGIPNDVSAVVSSLGFRHLINVPNMILNSALYLAIVNAI